MGPPVRQELALEMRSFGRETLSDSARRQNVKTDTLVHQAILYYLSQRDVDRISVRVPDFVRSQQEPEANGDSQMLVTVDLEEAEWAALAEAARAERVTLERLVKHAVLLLLADLDQGRVTARILDD
jgi:hypothetical protein